MPLLAPILLLFIMCGSRLAYRLWKEHRLYGQNKTEKNLVLVLGAGDAAVRLVKELIRSVQWEVVGLLDDDPAKRGLMLHGFKVLGRISELPAVPRSFALGHAIIAMTSSCSRPPVFSAPNPTGATGPAPPRSPSGDEICSTAGVKALSSLRMTI